MSWQVVYKRSVKKDLKSIAKDMREITRRAIEEKLMADPVRYGMPLRGALRGYIKMRPGDYRVIYSVKNEVVTVHILKIGHRKEVYKKSF